MWYRMRDQGAEMDAETLVGVKITVVAQMRDNGCMGERIVDGIKRYLGWNWHELGMDWRRRVQGQYSLFQT